MKNISLEVIYASLLILHVVVNTISRFHQHRFGNNWRVFPSDKNDFDINLGNYMVIQTLYGIGHFTLITIGFLGAMKNLGSHASWVYLGLLVAGVLLVIIIFKNLKLSMNKKETHNCSHEDKYTWIGFYGIIVTGLIWFGYMNHWSLIMCYLLSGYSLLFFCNQTFERLNPRDTLSNSVSKPEEN